MEKDKYQPAVPDNGVYLLGSKTVLRRFRRTDCERMSLWGRHSDPLLAPYNHRPTTSLGWDEWFDVRVSADGVYAFAIESHARDLVGWLTLSDVSVESRNAVLGIDLDSRFVGRGFGSDGIRTLEEAYFSAWNFDSLSLEVAAPNIAARRCYEKCGFVMMGRKWRDCPDVSPVSVLSDERYADSRAHFRTLSGEFEVLHYDMKATIDTWRECVGRRER